MKSPLEIIATAKLGEDTKYASKNPIARRLVEGFFDCLAEVVREVEFKSALEIGCGEGVPLMVLGDQLAGKEVCGLDISAQKLALAAKNAPFAKLTQGSVYSLPYPDEHFDLVIVCEVLEHLEDPEAALREIKRVGRRHFVFSVPHEPFWSLLNMLRGAYLKEMGNTPGHVRKFSPFRLKSLLSGHFAVREIAKPLPWLMAVCKKQPTP